MNIEEGRSMIPERVEVLMNSLDNDICPAN